MFSRLNALKCFPYMRPTAALPNPINVSTYEAATRRDILGAIVPLQWTRRQTCPRAATIVISATYDSSSG